MIISDDYEIDSRAIRNSFFSCHIQVYYRQLPMHCKTSKSNDYYSPHILQDITNQYIYIYIYNLPLWSGIMLGDLSRYVPDVQSTEMQKGDAITRDTNSTIENYFGNLKSGIQTKQRYRVTNFIRYHYTKLSGRLIEARLYKPKNTLTRITKRYFRY